MKSVLWISIGLGAARAWATDLAINCGGSDVTTGGIAFVADRPYKSGAGSGYEGGVSVSHPLVNTGGTAVPAIHKDVRQGTAFAYRFDVPDGIYAVTLYFSENKVAIGGFRRFTVRVEGQPLVSNLDPAAVAGKEYAIEPRYVAAVSDGRLDVEVTATRGEATLAGIAVSPIAPDAFPPAAPPGTAHPGYGSVIVRWTRAASADLARYFLWRTRPGPPVLLTPDGTVLGRFIDEGAPAGVSSTYRLVAVDLWGNASAASEISAPPPLPPGGTALPIYDILLGPDERRFLFADAFRDIQVAGAFQSGSARLAAGVRNRGGTTRFLGKPNLKVIFRKGASWGGRDRINLKAEPISTSLCDERMASEFYRIASVPAPAVRPVHLRINGAYAGLYFDEEQVDRDFLVAHGFSDGSSVYKAIDYTLSGSADFNTFFSRLEQHEGSRQDHEELWQILAELRTVNEGDFDAWLAERFDRAEVCDFLAATALVGNSFDGSSYYVIRDRVDGKIRLIPWDLNNQTFGQHPADVPPVVDRPVLRNAMQAFGLDFDGWNLLWTRILMAPAARQRLADRIDALSVLFGGPSFHQAIQAAHDEIAQDAIADVRKNGWEDPSAFLNGVARIDQYVQGRLPFLAGELPQVRDPRGDLVLSEVMVANVSGPPDPNGDLDPWVEIENRAPAPRNLGGLYLSDDLRDRRKWQIPQGVMVPAHGRVVLWLDGEPSEGPLHAAFRLDPHGGALALSDGVVKKTLDAFIYGAQIPGVAYGRPATDDRTFGFLLTATPGAPNAGSPYPQRPVERVFHRPLFPGPTDTVNIVARIDSTGLAEAELSVDDGTATQLFSLQDDGLHGDGAIGDGVFGAFVPPRPAGAAIQFWVDATYTGGTVLHAPLDAPAATFRYDVHTLVPKPLVINEVVPRNDAGATDELGQHEDWVEIWNRGASPIDLSGMFLSDNPKSPLKWHFRPNTVMAPGGHLVVWLDGEQTNGTLHASFRLKSRSDQIVLTDRLDAGAITIDSVEIPRLPPDVAYARCPDGGGFRPTRNATPGYGNGGCLGP
ncbi:MAG: CotH kinase family protein [Acidobacteriota bacterium]